MQFKNPQVTLTARTNCGDISWEYNVSFFVDIYIAEAILSGKSLSVMANPSERDWGTNVAFVWSG